jgi:DNA/RNA-binding protein KIN17
MRANVVYNEYIQDKLHIHMNATQWTTLSGFVQYLGRTGKCVVDETEKVFIFLTHVNVFVIN